MVERFWEKLYFCLVLIGAGIGGTVIAAYIIIGFAIGLDFFGYEPLPSSIGRLFLSVSVCILGFTMGRATVRDRKLDWYDFLIILLLMYFFSGVMFAGLDE